MTKIFIVEDNEKYRDVAKKHFDSLKHNVDYAIDYDEAMNLISDKYNFALIDCFFPKKTGSNNIILGKELVKKMLEADPTENKVKKVINEFDKYININDEKLGPMIRAFAYENEEGITNPVFLSIKRVGDTLGREIATKITTNSLGLLYTPSHLAYSNRNKRPDYYGELEKAIEKSEANQPLGILIGERLKELKIPFVFVTSTYHHDTLTQPVCDYISRNELGSVVDCSHGKEDEKATPEFWRRAFNYLKEGNK